MPNSRTRRGVMSEPPPTAHTGHPNQDTHAEAGQHIGQTGRGQRGHARLMLLGYSAQSSFEGDAQEELNGQASCEMHAWKRLRACATGSVLRRGKRFHAVLLRFLSE